MSQGSLNIRIPTIDTPSLLGRVCYIMACFPELEVLPIKTRAHTGASAYPCLQFRCQVPLDSGFTLSDLINDLRDVINPTGHMWTSFAEFDKETSKTYLKVKVWL